ncbi:hypothetical protein C1H46_031220 [Malus baccata]|uniref:Uncharacterized protein n=1 Tax=Malus baccata TaxID=106549 RepID=A0A540L9Q4_MALBA|nr:hypothetical protein C1H46_031220 [Malus baccata]
MVQRSGLVSKSWSSGVVSHPFTESCCIGLLERMAEDNHKMEGYFGKKHLIPDGGFSPESKY